LRLRASDGDALRRNVGVASPLWPPALPWHEIYGVTSFELG